MKKNKIVERWVITVDSPILGIYDIKMDGVDFENVNHARAYGKKFGKVLNVTPIYQKQ